MKTNWLRHALAFFLSAGLALSFSALAEDGPDAAKALVWDGASLLGGKL